MEEMKKNQAENENMPAPKSLKKVNSLSVILLIVALICFILFRGVIPVIIGWVLLIVAFVINKKYRVNK